MNDNPRNILPPNRSNTLNDTDYPLAFRVTGVSVENAHAKLPDRMFIVSGAKTVDTAGDSMPDAAPVPDSRDRILLLRAGDTDRGGEYCPEILAEAYLHAGEVVVLRRDGSIEQVSDAMSALDTLYGIAATCCPEAFDAIEGARRAERNKCGVLLELLAMDGMEATGRRRPFAISDVRQTLAQVANVRVSRTLFGGDGPIASQTIGETTGVLGMLRRSTNGKYSLLEGSNSGRTFSRDHTAWRALLRHAAAAAEGISGHDRAEIASLATTHPLVKGKKRFADVFGDPQIALFQTLIAQ